MRGKANRTAGNAESATKTQFTEAQVKQVQAAMRLVKQDISDWREKSRVDPQKMKEPLTR